MENKYSVRITDPFGRVRIVQFNNVRFHNEDGRTVVYGFPTGKIKAVYPPNYSLEISELNGDKGD